MSRKRLSRLASDGGKLCIFQCQPFAAGALEVHLHAAFVAAALGIRHHALAEFLVKHALADAPHRIGRNMRFRRRRTCREGVDVTVRFITAGGKRLARTHSGGDPVQQFFRQFAQETRHHAVAAFAHAACGSAQRSGTGGAARG